jgi:hypothetical protein
MKNSGIKLSDLNPALRAQVMAQIKPVDTFPGTLDGAPLVIPGEGKARLRQDTKGPNKTEAAFLNWIRARNPDALVKEQGITLRLANGTKYTPDVFVRAKTGEISLFEVKGFMRDDAAVKIKVAAFSFKFWRFYLVTAQDRSLRSWHTQEIFP